MELIFRKQKQPQLGQNYMQLISFKTENDAVHLLTFYLLSLQCNGALTSISDVLSGGDKNVCAVHK